MKKPTTEFVKTTLRLPRKLWDETRIAAIRERKTVTQYLIAVLTAANKKAGGS